MTTLLDGIASVLTPHDLEERKNFITASEVSAIMGTSPWKNAADLYFDKVMDLAPLEPTDAMAWGSLMEMILVKWARHTISKRLGIPITTTRNGCRRKHPNGIMSATLDARIVGMPAAIECKTHALTYRKANLEEWGPTWSDEIPQYYLDQVCAQFACSPDIQQIYVILCLGFTMPRVYLIEKQRHLARIADIELDVCDWWEAHIIPGIAPSDMPSADTIGRMKIQKQVGLVASGIPDAILERRKEIGSLIGKLKKEQEELDARIAFAMGSGLQGISPKGHRVVMQHVHRNAYHAKETDYLKTNIYLAH